MRTREKERYQKLLLQMKEDVLRELKHFETNQRDSAKEMAGEVSNFMTHPADMGSVMQEREKAFWLASHGREILMQINDALMRIETALMVCVKPAVRQLMPKGFLPCLIQQCASIAKRSLKNKEGESKICRFSMKIIPSRDRPITGQRHSLSG